MALRRSLTTRFLVTNGAIPLHSSMEYKLATSRRPARAVGYPAQGQQADSDGGGTAGTSLAGVVAASVTNNHICEIPHPAASRRRAAGPNGDPPPPPAWDRPRPLKGLEGSSQMGPRQSPMIPPYG